MNVGFELPNRSDGLLTNEDWRRWDALKATVAKARNYHLRKETLDMLSLSKPTIILRPNSDGDFEVADRARELRDGIIQLKQWDFPLIVCVPDSEPNLHNKPVPEDYWTKISQVIAHPSLVNLWGEQVKIASPPLAVAQGEEAWYDAAGPELLGAFDFIGFHGYGQLSADLLHRSIALAMQWGPPLLMAECGDSHETASQELKANSVASYLRIAAESRTEIATLFIMSSNGDWEKFVFSPETIERFITPTVEFINAPA